MKLLYKLPIRLLARWSGVEADIKATQRIETANHLAKAGEYFKAGFTPNTKVANALQFYSTNLKAGNKFPDLLVMVYAVTKAGTAPLFEEVKKDG